MNHPLAPSGSDPTRTRQSSWGPAETIRSAAGRFGFAPVYARQGPAAIHVGMTPYATALARRMAPDTRQVQVLLGTLLGAGRLVAADAGVCFVLSLRVRHRWLVDWTYERLAPLVPAPRERRGRVEIRSDPHPAFGEVAVTLARRRALRRSLGAEALWLWSLYQRIGPCEREDVAVCLCGALRPPRRRVALAPAS